MRAAGALLLAAGATALFIRKGVHHGWSDFALLLLVAVPAGLLFRLATSDPSGGETAEPSRAVTMIASIGLALPAIAELMHVLGAATGGPFVTAVILLLTALVAVYGAIHARVSYAVLLAAIAILIAWLILWGQAFSSPTPSDFRGVLVFGGVILLFPAYWLAQRHEAFGAREIATVAGVALVAAGTLGIFVGATAVFTHALDPLLSRTPGGLNASVHVEGGQSLGWDLYLVLVSVGLIWMGARVRSRGIAYTGGFGIFFFVLSIGYQVARLDAGKAAAGSLAGWPIVLMLVGAAGLIAASLRHS